jgi:hypothetical protein
LGRFPTRDLKTLPFALGQAVLESSKQSALRDAKAGDATFMATVAERVHLARSLLGKELITKPDGEMIERQELQDIDMLKHAARRFLKKRGMKSTSSGWAQERPAQQASCLPKEPMNLSSECTSSCFSKL